MTSPETIERITRSLAYMLRHQPAEFGLELDPYGWADVEDVLRALQERTGETYEFADLDFAVHAGDRPRYEIQDGRIRALYGHSIEVLPGEPSRPPEFLYVGIDRRDADRAVNFGLKSGRRRFLHLAKTPDDARDAARRAGREWAILTIFALDAWEEGVNFYDRKSLFLAESVPTDYLEINESGSDGFEPVQRERGGEHHGARREHGPRRHGQGAGRFSEHPRRRDEPGRGRDSERPPERERSPERASEPDRHREPERAREIESERPRESEGARGQGRSAGTDRPRREWTDRPPRESGAPPRGRPERPEHGERSERPPERSERPPERSGSFAASSERGAGPGAGRDRHSGHSSSPRFQGAASEDRVERSDRPDRGGERVERGADRGGDRGGDRGRFGAPRGDRPPERSHGDRPARGDRPRQDAPAPAPRETPSFSEPKGDFGSGIFEPKPQASHRRPEREQAPERETRPAPPRPRAEPPPPADDFGAGV